eukprot:6181735-Pleurochrysis_carterae.AAC.3
MLTKCSLSQGQGECFHHVVTDCTHAHLTGAARASFYAQVTMLGFGSALKMLLLPLELLPTAISRDEVRSSGVSTFV